MFNIISCQKDRIEHKYYASGKIMYSYQLKGGLRDGAFTDYYETGAVKAIGLWENGKLNGEYRSYYPDGRLENVFHWKSGLANGLFITYYENGRPKIKSFWSNGKRLGWSYDYYSTGIISNKLMDIAGSENELILVYDAQGKLKEKHIRNKDGALIYLTNYEQDGKEKPGFVVPFFRKSEAAIPFDNQSHDTVQKSSYYHAFMFFGVKINNKTKLLISSSKNFKDNLDTLSLSATPTDRVFEIKIKVRKIGEDRFFYKFICTTCASDTLLNDGVIGSHTFFVKK